jgi:hypothetical protein
MAKGGAEYINHFNAVRMRVTGSGQLRTRFLSLDESVTQTLEPLDMSATTNIQPTVLANFKQQRAQIELKTTEKDEYFVVTRIIVFVKRLFTSFPQ